MSEFRIEKIRRRVMVTMAGGGTLQGDLFLQPSARYRLGPQEPVELFNEPDAFLPLATAGDHLVMIAKSQVIRVQFERAAADTDDEGVEEASVDVVFSDGSVTSGQLRMVTRADRPRLLDFLNDDHQPPFLTVRSPQGTILINRRQIVQVRQRR
jgi:hypothetical protein